MQNFSDLPIFLKKNMRQLMTVPSAKATGNNETIYGKIGTAEVKLFASH